MFYGSKEHFIGIISEKKIFWKKTIKCNEHWMHFVKLSFAATLFLYAIRRLIFIWFHWYLVNLLHEYTGLWM